MQLHVAVKTDSKLKPQAAQDAQLSSFANRLGGLTISCAIGKSLENTVFVNMNQTYLALIKPIPPRTNLSNIASTSPSTPCPRCSLLIPPRSKTREPTASTQESFSLTDHYPSFPVLKASSKTCDVCKFLRKAIRAQWAARPMEEWGAGPLRQGDGLWDELLSSEWDGEVKIGNVGWDVDNESGMVTSLSLEFGPVKTVLDGPDGEEVRHGEIGQVIGFKAFDSKDLDLDAEKNRRRLPSTETLSPSNLDMIKSWIHDCKTQHRNCQLPSVLSWLPTRLLDVLPENPRLVSTATESTKPAGPYVALSHMWGSPTQAPPLRTLTHNIDLMREGIEMWKLPKNFAEAVIVTRKLGIRYVWIDSLCIIQDSSEDWGREAKTMHQVYKYAEVTVVATSATCSHDGFLGRDVSMIPLVKYSYASTKSPAKEESIILASQPDGGTWIHDIEGIAWNQRGWTMQERSLSIRLLHFSNTKCYFECRTCLKSEENERLRDETRRRMFQMWPVSKGQIVVTSEREEEVFSQWRRVVSEYSQRGLTKGSDKLVAIASVAAEMSAHLGNEHSLDSYISSAGMWRNKLNVELMWHVKDGLASLPWELRAPSWSWAAIDARVGWHETYIRKQEQHECLRDAELNVQDHSENNRLEITGITKQISGIEECDNDERWLYGTRGLFPHDIYTIEAVSKPHLPLDEHPESSSGDSKQKEVKFAEARLDLDDKDALTRSGRVLGYVHINSTYRPSGLVFERSSSKDLGMVWKRVGVATIFDKNGNLFSAESFDKDDTMEEIMMA